MCSILQQGNTPQLAFLRFDPTKLPDSTVLQIPHVSLVAFAKSLFTLPADMQIVSPSLLMPSTNCSAFMYYDGTHSYLHVPGARYNYTFRNTSVNYTPDFSYIA